MLAGALRHLISFTTPTVTGQDSHGGDVITDTSVGTFYSNVEALNGGELAAARQRFAEARYKITMRYQPDVTFTRIMTITWGTQTLDILDIQQPDGYRSRELVFTCKDHVA